MTHDTNPPPKAPGAFAAELCASFIARNPLLAMLLRPFLAYVQRTMDAFESLLAALRAGHFTPLSGPAPAARSTPARPTSLPAPRIAAPRARLHRPRPPARPPCARSPISTPAAHHRAPSPPFHPRQHPARVFSLFCPLPAPRKMRGYFVKIT